MITLRYQLDHATIPVGAETSTDVAARMDGTLYARNESDTVVDLEFQALAAYELDWLLTRRDGVTFKPMFLPPPMPPAGGIPMQQLRLEPRVEIAVTSLHGISGFYEEARGHQDWGPLPAGHYEGVIRNIDLGTGPLATAPFSVVVE